MNRVVAKKGFTLLELLVTIAITIIALATFFRLYTASVRTDRATAIRTSANVFGEQMMETIEKSVRLVGLNNEFSEFEDVSSIFINLGGSDDGESDVNFAFMSPYGGPITKLTSDADPSCTSFTMISSPNMTGAVTSIKLMSREGMFLAEGIAWTFSDEIMTAAPGEVKDLDGNAISFECDIFFPSGTLVTGIDHEFTLSYDHDDKKLKFERGSNILFEVDPENSKYNIPFFVLEFLREYEEADEVKREWTISFNSDDEIRQIKAVRVGFILVSDQELRVKTGEDTDFEVKYCPFEEDVCYSHTERNKAAYMFRRVMHIRNFDYMERNKNAGL